MLSAALFALVFQAAPPTEFRFDADKIGQLPPFMQVSPAGASWIVAYEAGSTPSNRVLSITPSAEVGTVSECSFKDLAFQEFNISLRLRIVPPQESKDLVNPEEKQLDESGLYFRAANNQSCRIVISAAAKTVKLVELDGKEPRTLATAPFPENSNLRWFTFALSVTSKGATCAIDGKKVLESSDVSVRTYGKLGFFSNGRAAVQIDDISITNTQPVLTQSLRIRGMTCILCEAKIENALKAIKGVKDAKANHTDGTCLVTLDENDPADIAALVKAVEEINYHVDLEGA